MADKKKRTKDLEGNHLLPECLNMKEITERMDDTESNYTKVLQRMAVLDGADRGKLWQSIKAKFPGYQMTPESNWINYIKDNIYNSIYTTGRFATLFPKSPDDSKFVAEFNSALETVWDNIKAPKYQAMAGERASLLNIGITQVGWRKTIIGGTTDHWYKGDVVFKNIDPMKFRRDPYADSFDDASFCYYFDHFSVVHLKSKSIYKERLKELLEALGPDLSVNPGLPPINDHKDKGDPSKVNSKYHKLTQYFEMYTDEEGGDYKIAEIHILDDKFVLYCNPDLKPRSLPFAILYCNEPAGDIVGASTPSLIMGNNVIYNLINSIYATAAYKAQRPPRFVNTQSGINIRQFAKHGVDADKTWIVNGDASTAVHYGQFPQLPIETMQLKMDIKNDIKEVSGVDDRYAGKDMGSIQTTGGSNNVVAAATLRDNGRITLYEEYSIRLTELVVNNYIHFGDKRSYTITDSVTGSMSKVDLDFPKVDDDVRFRYSLDVQTYLPRNQQRMAAVATMLLEKQMQYNSEPAIITPEEWLLCQDIPFKDLIFKRMGIQRNISISEQVAQTIEMFAQLLEGGANPEDAIQDIANTLQGQETVTGLGNTASAPEIADLVGAGTTPNIEAGSPQAAQMGGGMDPSQLF